MEPREFPDLIYADQRRFGSRWRLRLGNRATLIIGSAHSRVTVRGNEFDLGAVRTASVRRQPFPWGSMGTIWFLFAAVPAVAAVVLDQGILGTLAFIVLLNSLFAAITLARTYWVEVDSGAGKTYLSFRKTRHRLFLEDLKDRLNALDPSGNPYAQTSEGPIVTPPLLQHDRINS